MRRTRTLSRGRSYNFPGKKKFDAMKDIVENDLNEKKQKWYQNGGKGDDEGNDENGEINDEVFG